MDFVHWKLHETIVNLIRDNRKLLRWNKVNKVLLEADYDYTVCLNVWRMHAWMNCYKGSQKSWFRTHEYLNFIRTISKTFEKQNWRMFGWNMLFETEKVLPFSITAIKYHEIIRQNRFICGFKTKFNRFHIFRVRINTYTMYLLMSIYFVVLSSIKYSQQRNLNSNQIVTTSNTLRRDRFDTDLY